jgi:hypothetical protein
MTMLAAMTLDIALHSIAGQSGNVVEKMVAWTLAWAPWMSESDARQLANIITANPQRFTADKLAWRLRLTHGDRTRLGVKTIGCVDVTKAERARLRKARKSERQKERRREAGVRSRSQYEGESISRVKPWEAKGISRTTWFRRRKANGTSLKPNKECNDYIGLHTSATASQLEKTALSHGGRGVTSRHAAASTVFRCYPTLSIEADGACLRRGTMGKTSEQ